MFRYGLFILLYLGASLCALPLSAQSDEYAAQAAVIEELLEERNYRVAMPQSKALITSGEEAQLPAVEARGRFLLGRALTENPTATAKERVAGIRELRKAANTFKRVNDGVTLEAILSRLEALTGNKNYALTELPSVDGGNQRLPSSEAIDSATITAIVSLQGQQIEELNTSQMRQMIQLQQQQRQLDEYAFRSLNDSLLLMQQQLLIDQQEASVQQGKLQRNLTLVIAGAALLFLALLYSRFRSSKRYQLRLEDQNKIITHERQRSEELLLNILPVTVAAELKETGKATARKYDDATVLFADFKGFSSLAKGLEPEVLVGYLDEAFRAFDDIVRQFGLEKIKTIGDAYMCAGGLPTASEDHPLRMVRAALKMQDYLRSNPHFSARIGIHTGPLVAGVVGQDKFVYDVWGDTVNQAARLEASGEAGRVAVSATVANRVAQHCTCVPAGTIIAKNIGEMERFWVEAE